VGAYLGNGKNGRLNVTVEGLMRDGTAQAMWRQALDALARAELRGFQPADPRGCPPPSVAHRALSGPRRESDWTYWGELKVLPLKVP